MTASFILVWERLYGSQNNRRSHTTKDGQLLLPQSTYMHAWTQTNTQRDPQTHTETYTHPSTLYFKTSKKHQEHNWLTGENIYKKHFNKALVFNTKSFHR